MMPKEKQVTSLELSKRLENVGVKQDSIFWWVKHIKSGTNHYIWDLVYGKDENDLVNVYVSAFTVAELGEMLPDWADFTQKHYNSTSKEIWYRGYAETVMMWFDEKTEADSRAKMLIYLIENKLVEAKKQ